MKINSKHILPEVRAVYERMIEVFFYFKPMEDLNETVHQEFFGYGTAAHEFVKSRKELQKMAMTQAEQLREQNFEISRKGVLEKSMADGTACLIVEEFDLYLSESDHRMQMRLSTILELIDGDWLVTHFHGSTPDSDIDEAEALPMEGLRKKNAELEAKIKERTRDLEIETALEKVRTASMAMQKGEELAKVISVVFAQLKALGIDSEGCTLNLYDKEEGMDIWMSGFGEDVHPRSFHISYFDHPYYRMQLNDWKNGEKYKILAFEGDLKKSYDEKTFSNKDFFELPKDIRKEFLAKERKLSSAAYMKYGMLEMIGDEALSDSQGDILCRFAKVFEQAYTRYLDIQQAEAQAREAQIETALERVRSRSMGMQKSEELKDVVKVIFDQLAHLSINAEHAGIVVDYEPKKDWHFWIAETQDIPAKVTVPYLDLVWDRQFTEAKKKGKDFFTTLMDFEEKNSFYKVLLPHVEGLTKKVKDFYFSCPGLAISTAIEKDIGLYIENFSGTPYSSEENDILRRFTKVFQQTYTRFLDLKKAEAQAREAQIETALERVRSRSMAMHKSEELADLSLELVKQVQALGVDTWFCAFNIYDDDSKGSLEWGSNGQGTFPEYRTPMEGIFLRYYEAGQKGETLLINEIGEDECPAHYDYLCTLPGVGEQLLKMKDKGIPFPTSQIDHVAFFKYGYVLFITYEPSPESHEIFKRFAKVFEQTYTRFLDLQKAEAQAREAQIETALEKVRSRSLAMHSTSEMQQVANEVYEQLQNLGLEMDAVGMSGVIKAKNDYDVWIGGSTFAEAVRIPFNEDTEVQRDYNRAIEERAELFTRTYSGKVKEEYTTHLLTHGEFSGPLKKKMETSPAFSTSISFSKYSSIQIARYTEEPYSREENEILKRFSRVFEQAYIRFMDLQKAEKQAREAQIESSLERVRARSMAMHASDELNDVLSTLFQQFDVLGIKPVTAFLSLFDIENNTFTYRSTSKAGNRMQTQQVVDLNSMEIWQEMAEKWKKDKQDSLEVIYYSPEILPQLFDLFEETFSAMPEEERMTIADYPNGGYSMHGYCKFGYIGYNHIRLPTDEEKEILIKFATEFGRVYQRFLDIQKAEAQAKEAQIEAALEKVRSQSLAMHTTSEMQLVANAVYDQLRELGVVMDAVGMSGVIEEKKDYDVWIGGAPMGKVLRIPYNKDTKVQRDYNKAIKERPDLFAKTYSGKVKEEYVNHLLTHGDFPKGLKRKMVTSSAFSTSISFAKNSSIQIARYTNNQYTAEENEILKRFAKVFEQAYIRFMDLEKAEAQAKEAQIEAALEKVRSASLAMHQSKDLHNVLEMLYNQLDALGLKMHSAQILESIEDPKAMHSWIVTNGVVYPEQVSVPFSKDLFSKRFREAVTNGESFYTLKLSKQQKDKFFHHFFDNSSFKNVPQERKDLVLSSPGLGISNAIGKYTSLSIMRYDGILYSEEENEIIKRFLKVFEQSYTRFLDLQKAEYQAKEAQIEAALEKVRSRSMAMHKSEEMLDLIVVVSEQLRQLDLKFDTVSFAKNDTEGAFTFWLSSRGQPQPLLMEVPPINHPVINSVYEAKESGLSFISDVFSATENKEWSKHIIKHSQLKQYPETVKDFILNAPGFARSSFFLKNIDLYVGNYKAVPYSDEENSIFRRFAKAFEQAYTRFLDLQKAENQARESQIEAALERVRSKTMAMHNSQDLENIVISLFDEVMNLGLDKSLRCGIGILEGHEGMETRSVNTNTDGSLEVRVGMLNMTIHPMLVGLKKAWSKGHKGYSYEYTAKDVRKYYEALNKEPEYPFNADLESLPEREYHKSFFYSSGIIFVFSENPISEESTAILARFAAVFGQTYRRFLDLQKAEAQAREAQIEAALERVRARTMAMHNSEDIGGTVTKFFNELLGLHADNSIRCGVGILSQSAHMELWTASVRKGTQTVLDTGTLDMSLHPLLKGVKKTWTNKEKAFSYTLKGKDVKKYFQVLNEAPDYPAHFNLNALPEFVYHNSFFFGDGVLFAFTEAPLQDDIRKVLERFTSVFGQTYTRFLDLQKAEAQAREAQVEAALEKVRSQSLAMHITSEMQLVANAVFDQLRELGLEMDAVGMSGAIEAKEDYDVWIGGAPMGEALSIPYNKDTKVQRDYNKVIKERPEIFARTYSGKVKEEYINHLLTHGEFPGDLKKKMVNSSAFSTSISFAENSGIQIARYTNKPYSEEENGILKRFAKVFEQAYIRFMDIEKAEAQARESKIEVALERVRSRAMAMHHTDELTDVLGVLFDQFDFLGINPVLTHLTLFDEENETFTLRITTGGKKRVIAEQLIDVNAVESWKTSFANWKKSELHTVDFIEYPPEALPAVWELLDEVMSALPEENKIYPKDFPEGLFTTQGHCKYGYIGFNHNRKATEEEIEIVIRFAKEFGRLYQRFLDIQKAELQARDALKQATLDRVRGQIASMRSTEDLDRITPLIWNELKALEIPFIRCGVFIIDESSKTVQAFLSAPDGHSLGAMKIPFDAEKVTAATVAHWKKNEVYRTHWDKSQFLEFMQLMKDLGQVSNEKEYQGAEQPPESLHLHFVPFTQGMLYVGNVGPLEDEQIELIQTLADAFAIAYARYEDFVKLEKAKEQVENTLEELQATQNQLVQSEKMASLGELTAGIAHEIQNPLNFVNNFSEVSVELLEEMLEEMSKGDMEEAKALMEDIKQNLDKINHHGKRADGIVKGMLQHSRTSSGEKELTDLNVLADEYLRLAYHGLRAKDKTFNATLDTHFDESIGKVNVLAQDMGRVILNLITNAFYVVKKKSEEQPDGYVPTVTVSTKKTKNGVEINVKDNGNGIPDSIKEKIFQPFFTTKPTGQGTGLGLSMSYDIVTKGHGGELRVDTKEGQGTTFTIVLPIN